jgi:far upstream element-binding protein
MDGPEVAGPQRHCRITGSRAARAAAKNEIYRIIDDNEVSKRGGPAQEKPRQQQSSKVTITKEGDSLQMMVPDRTVGLIIGRGGETIRDLQDRSGCHVNIVGENKSINGLRPVNLIGSASAQQYARDLILEIVESDQKGISVKDLHREREDVHSSGGGGSVGGFGGGGGGGGGSKINDSIVVPGDAVGMIIGKGMRLVTNHHLLVLTIL